jgi:hypothetical protein
MLGRDCLRGPRWPLWWKVDKSKRGREGSLMRARTGLLLAAEAEGYMDWRLRWVRGERLLCTCVPTRRDSRRAQRVTRNCSAPVYSRIHSQHWSGIIMDTNSTGPGPTTIGCQPEPEPKPIRRLQDEVINRIAAGEVSPPFRVLPACHPSVYCNCTRSRSDAMPVFVFFWRSYIARLLPSRNCLKTVWMRAPLLFVSPLGTGV